MSRSAVEFRELHPGDLEHLAANLRAQDTAELEAAGRGDALEVLRECVAQSDYVRVATADGEPGCVFGARCTGTWLTPSAIVWMLGTDLVRVHQRALASKAPRYIQAMRQKFGRLYNCVHADNTLAIGWLKRSGFALSPATPHPRTGELFHYFEMD